MRRQAIWLLCARQRRGDLVAVDAETVAVLRLAARLFADSGGLFDVTIGRQLVASGFLPRVGAHPLSRFAGNATDIEIVDGAHVRCRRPVLIDLGGIAKGHAVDLAVAAMRSAGAARGIVNAGGDLRVFGDVAETIWLRGGDGALQYAIEVRDAAVASSSNLLSRRRAHGAKTSPHFGRARKPVFCDRTITVVAPECAFADAMTRWLSGSITAASV